MKMAVMWKEVSKGSSELKKGRYQRGFPGKNPGTRARK